MSYCDHDDSVYATDAPAPAAAAKVTDGCFTTDHVQAAAGMTGQHSDSDIGVMTSKSATQATLQQIASG